MPRSECHDKLKDELERITHCLPGGAVMLSILLFSCYACWSYLLPLTFTFMHKLADVTYYYILDNFILLSPICLRYSYLVIFLFRHGVMCL